MMCAKEVAKPHIAFLPSPGIGHLIPLLEFAKHLVVHHNVLVSFLVINNDQAPAMQQRLIHSSNLPTDLHVIALPPADTSSSCLNDNMNILTRLTRICQASFKQLRATLIELNFPKALIIDIFATDAFVVCTELGIPVYTFFTSPTKLLALSFYLPKLDEEVHCEYVDLPDPIQVPGCKPLEIDDLLGPLLNRKDEEYRCYLRHVSRLAMAAGVFVNTWDELELKSCWLNGINNNPFYKALRVPPVYLVGPLIKRDETVAESDNYIISWLDNQSPNSVLFVALGSGGTVTSEQLTELALGLEMSNQKFVLVVRKPSDHLSACGMFFNVGRYRDDPISYLPEGFVERTAGVGLVVPSWAPQVHILSHESTGGFMSHCGWNSTLESIVHGVPMITWPLYAEQKMNATLLTEEIAIAVKPIEVSTEGGKKLVKKEEIERVVRLLMEGEEGKAMRGKANELRESAAKAAKPGGTSYDLVASVVKFWK